MKYTLAAKSPVNNGLTLAPTINTVAICCDPTVAPPLLRDRFLPRCDEFNLPQTLL